jgi:hypothetical protein
LKIGLPRIRLSRKVLLISVGMLALLGGSGAAALYAGVGDMLIKDTAESPAGGECKTVQTVVLKTPARRLWLRKFISMDHADGSMRIKTALRVAGLLAKANDVDLIQVNVLDSSGPTVRAAMRDRAIGAEVIIALQPQYLPDMKEPFIVRYYDGTASDEGRYYGERISLDLAEIKKLMAAMRDVADKQDCTELPRPGEQSPEGEAKPPGEHVVSAASEHEAKPAEEHGAEPAAANEHGAPADNADAKGHETAPKAEKSFLDSVLSMVGLGGSEAKPTEAHDAKATVSEAPAEDDAKPAEHGATPAEDGKVKADTGKHAPADAEKATDAHADAEKPADARPEAKPAEHSTAPVEDDKVKAETDKHAPADAEKAADKHAEAEKPADTHAEATPDVASGADH